MMLLDAMKWPLVKGLGLHIRALTIRIGLWGIFTVLVIRKPQNSIGKYVGLYIFGERSGGPLGFRVYLGCGHHPGCKANSRFLVRMPW